MIAGDIPTAQPDHALATVPTWKPLEMGQHLNKEAL